MLTDEQVTDELKVALNKYFGKYPVVYQWLLDFKSLCHIIDDKVDLKERQLDHSFFGLICNQFIEVLSHDFYVQNRAKLYSIAKNCLHQYFLSVEWENSTNAALSQHADVIRCCYNQMVVAVTEIVVLEETGSYKAAYEAGQEIQKLAVIKSYYNHHKSDGTPI